MLIIPIYLKVAVTLPYLTYHLPTVSYYLPYLTYLLYTCTIQTGYWQDTGYRIQDTSYIIQWDASTYPLSKRGGGSWYLWLY